jgi:uncharacterized membrane protein YfhO
MRRDFFTPRATGSPRAAVFLKESAATEYTMTVAAPRYSLVVSSIPWWPGWKVTRNGERVAPIRVNGVFLGFAVPPGRYDVRIWYAPTTFRAGVCIAIIAIAFSAAVALHDRRRPKRLAP